MTLSALSLLSGLFWVDTASKQALICPIEQFDVCVAQISSQVRSQLPKDRYQLKEEMSERHMMVLPVSDPHLAGLIFTASEHLPQSQVLYIDNEKFEWVLSEQAELSLWHEIGHLEAQVLAGDVFGRVLTPFEHEWVADCYLVWKVAHEKPDLTLAWQQYHRRNVDVIANKRFRTHWTVPVLWSVLREFDHKALQSFTVFSDFLTAYYANAVLPSKTDLFELSNLLQRTFDMGVTPALPNYLFWRKSELTTYLRPTLDRIMGQEKAATWIRTSSLRPVKNEQ